MAHTHLKKITAAAKAIRRKHPNKKWTDCIKQASKQVKLGAVKYIEKGETKKTPATKVYRVQRKKAGTFNGYKKVAGPGTISGHVSSAKGLLVDAIAKLEARRFTAKKKSDKRRIGKDITALKVRYRKLS